MSIKRLSGIFSLRNVGSPSRQNHTTASVLPPAEQASVPDGRPQAPLPNKKSPKAPSRLSENVVDTSMVRVSTDGSLNQRATDSNESDVDVEVSADTDAKEDTVIVKSEDGESLGSSDSETGHMEPRECVVSCTEIIYSFSLTSGH